MKQKTFIKKTERKETEKRKKITTKEESEIHEMRKEMRLKGSTHEVFPTLQPLRKKLSCF
jgi:hypothetical protein